MKADLAITLPADEARATLRRIGEEIRFAIYSKNTKIDPLKLFPELRPKDDEQLLLSEGPTEFESTLPAHEAIADIEALMRAEGTLTATELFEDEDDRPPPE